MNNALKHWKEAATVILAAGTRSKVTAGIPYSSFEESTPVPPAISRLSDLSPKSAFDYEVLLLKRSSKSGFMPNAHVFPGGIVDASDFSSEWLDIFKSFKNFPNFGLGTVKQPVETRPPIFATDRLKLGSPVPGEMAFRICAVRETFEECGVLLVVPKQEENSLVEAIKVKSDENPIPPQLPKEIQMKNEGELAKWRALVNENPSNFIRMCRELEVLPNIWSLYEWGNWLTPTGVHEKRRYDTAFFLCCLQDPPHAVQDEKEIVNLKWWSPPEVLQSYQDRHIWIAPPQFYDLSRMCRYPSLDDLLAFASRRSSEGCEHWLPVRIVTDTSSVTLLPGDELYPEDSAGQVELHLDTGAPLEDMGGTSALHRIVQQDPYTAAVHMTVEPKYSHVPPFTGPLPWRRPKL